MMMTKRTVFTLLLLPFRPLTVVLNDCNPCMAGKRMHGLFFYAPVEMKVPRLAHIDKEPLTGDLPLSLTSRFVGNQEKCRMRDRKI